MVRPSAFILSHLNLQEIANINNDTTLSLIVMGRAIGLNLKSYGYNVTYCYNKDYNYVWSHFEAFCQQLESENTEFAIFYYLGHGAQEANDEKLATIASISGPSQESISLALIMERINKISSLKLKLIVVDACRMTCNENEKTIKAPLRNDTILIFSTKAGEAALHQHLITTAFSQCFVYWMKEDVPFEVFLGKVLAETAITTNGRQMGEIYGERNLLKYGLHSFLSQEELNQLEKEGKLLTMEEKELQRTLNMIRTNYTN